ncbi:MAG: hypothetical protein IKT06_03765 [Aeriscardovia sp.]|nr:hypothetical protein [Aeriscardovia sp.]
MGKIIIKLVLAACIVLVVIGIWVSLSRSARGDLIAAFKWAGEMFRQGWGAVSKKF